jgi:pyruvate/2-oxoglutarate dehydrogenase complex dihydrolipoamide dehydrogenase (E3) component
LAASLTFAYYHGEVIARRLRGIDARADHTAVPRVTFTDPEVASVGLSEAAARRQGHRRDRGPHRSRRDRARATSTTFTAVR